MAERMNGNIGSYKSHITGKTYKTAGAMAGAEKRQLSYEEKTGTVKGAYGAGGRMAYRTVEELLALRWYYDNLPSALKADANRHHSSSWIIINGMMAPPGRSGKQLFLSGMDGGSISNMAALAMIYGERQAEILRKYVTGGETSEEDEEEDEDEESDF